MKVGVMQPYFLPYIGYWQLLNFVDRFVIYDNIQYVKRGWLNRNRYLKDGKDTLFSIPLKKDSDYLDINKRVISDSFSSKKLINIFDIAYKSAPYYLDVLPLLSDIINISHKNLFRYIYESVILMCSFLDIDSSKIIISSDIETGITPCLRDSHSAVDIQPTVKEGLKFRIISLASFSRSIISKSYFSVILSTKLPL